MRKQTTFGIIGYLLIGVGMCLAILRLVELNTICSTPALTGQTIPCQATVIGVYSLRSSILLIAMGALDLMVLHFRQKKTKLTATEHLKR